MTGDILCCNKFGNSCNTSIYGESRNWTARLVAYFNLFWSCLCGAVFVPSTS